MAGVAPTVPQALPTAVGHPDRAWHTTGTHQATEEAGGPHPAREGQAKQAGGHFLPLCTEFYKHFA